MKTILMTIVLGMLFIGCEQYNSDPLVKAEEMSLINTVLVTDKKTNGATCAINL